MEQDSPKDRLRKIKQSLLDLVNSKPVFVYDDYEQEQHEAQVILALNLLDEFFNEQKL